MNPERRKVGVIGAGGLVGRALMALPEKADRTIVAYSRSAYPSQAGCSVVWKRLGDPNAVQTVSNWISAAPIWGLSVYFDFLERCGATRLAVLSSNSADVKSASADPAERNLAVRLKQAEEEIAFWAKAMGIAYTILRPVMIYGMGLDLQGLINQTYVVEEEYKNLTNSYNHLSELIKGIIECLPNAIWVLEKEGEIFLQNSEAKRIEGLFPNIDLQKQWDEIEYENSFYVIRLNRQLGKTIISATDITEQRRKERLASKIGRAHV